MLRRVENVRVSFKQGFLSGGQGRVVLQVGTKVYTAFAKTQHDNFKSLLNLSQTIPVCVMRVGERSYWLFGGRWFSDNEGLNANQVHALILTRDKRRDETIRRAQSTVAMASGPQLKSTRGAIPDDVKLLVWTRDHGRCRKCGSNVELQFDHIIPWSMGGSSSPENIQVLCGPCNRRKGASVV